MDFVIDPPIEPEPEDEVPVAPIVKYKLPATPISRMLPKMLVTIRDAKGMTQRQVSMVTGVPRTYVSRVERGAITPTITSLRRMCGALEISLEVFLYLCEQAA